MNGTSVAPAGFRIETRGAATFIARAEECEALLEAGLDVPGGWEDRTGPAGTTSGVAGRGGTAILALPDGPRVRLKQLRRGGAMGALWCERFAGARRLLDNIRIPIEAARRGVATPLPVALLLLQGPPGLFRGWLGTEEVEATRDLASRVASGLPPDRRELDSAMRAVRTMHDAGLDHRDLNLGNLLLQTGAGSGVRAWVCDLDGSRLVDAPLAFHARQRSLRRLERSYVKVCGSRSPSEEIRDGIYRLYAGEDRELAARLERGRRAGRGRILLHRLGWRR